jgi:hypothetical protein
MGGGSDFRINGLSFEQFRYFLVSIGLENKPLLPLFVIKNGGVVLPKSQN